MVVGSLESLILKRIYANSIQNIPSLSSTLSRQLELDTELLEGTLSDLIIKGSINIDQSGHYNITEFGRKQIVVVMTGGVFDILHIGHIFTFQQAKLLGDVLVVVVATDGTVEKLKKRKPTNSQDERAALLKHIREVDAVVIGDEMDFINTIDLIKPDIVALGYDQKFDERKLYEQFVMRGHQNVKIIRLKEYIPGKSTSRIVKDIIFKHAYRSNKTE